MRGNLLEKTVPDLLFEIYFSRRSGILRLSQKEIKKSIYFKDGSIVFAHSNLKHERLGEILLKLGKITEEEFQTVSQQMEEGTRLGQALYERGYLSQSEIRQSVGYQLQQILYSVFNWDEGEYEFVDRERPVFEDIMVEVSTPGVIIEGIRNITNLLVLERALGGHEEDIVVLGSRTSRKLPRSDFDFAEETILACVDGKATLEKLRSISRLSSQEFARAFYSLILSGMISYRPVEPALETKLRQEVQKRWGAFTTNPMPEVQSAPPVPQERVRTLTEEEMRKLIQETSQKFRSMKDEEILGVTANASEQDIQSAYDRLSSIYHPPYYSYERYQDLKNDLKFIIDRLLEAKHSLLERKSPTVVQVPEISVPKITFPSPVSIQEKPASPIPPAESMQSSTLEPVVSAPAPMESASAEAQITGDVGIAALQSMLRDQPTNTGILRELGKKLQLAGKAREGEKCLLRALELEPRNVENHFSLVDFYNTQGLKFKAFKHLNIILQIEPDNQRALEMLGVKKRKKSLYEI